MAILVLILRMAKSLGWTFYKGDWNVTDGQYCVASGNEDKALYYNVEVPQNFTLEGRISVSDGEGSLIFNVRNAIGGADNFEGYACWNRCNRKGMAEPL